MYEDMHKRLKELSLKEIIGYAIASEEAASSFYWVLVKVFDPNELVRHKFESLAREEKLHKQTLLNLHVDLFGDRKYSVPDGLPLFESQVEVDTINNFIDALEIAMQNEDNAQKVYKFLARHHKQHRKLFNYLAQTEKSHYHTLKHEKAYLENETSDEPGHGKLDPSEFYSTQPFFSHPDVTEK